MRKLLKQIAFGITALIVVSFAREAHAQVGTCTVALGEAYLDINNVRARILNNGNLFWRGDPFVYEVPKGGGANAIFASGIWIGGYVGGQLRVAAARYGNYHFWAGPLDDNGAPPADCSEYDRLYKVSRGDIQEYLATGVTTPDLRDWPTGLGAPTLASPGNGVDDDGDGEMDEAGEQVFVLDQPLAQRAGRTIDLAGGERPAILGDQSIWWVMNDRGNDHNGAAGPPIGLEVHGMVFAFNTSGDIGNSTFYKYDLYYKGTEPYTDVHMAIFSDPDLGNYQDDWVGSDTTLGVGFVWNSDDDDEGGDGYGTPAPAAGYDFFQGPIVPGLPTDTANVSGEMIPGFRNLDMTSFTFYNNGGGVTEDPSTAMDHYNYMRGRWKDGKCITLGGNGRDFSDDCTSYMFPGDPGQNDAGCQYWSECNSDAAGTDIEAADRRFVMGTGPFTINPQDFQQIVFGIVWARGQNNFDSVQKLKQADALAQAAYDVNFVIPSPPNAPMVTATAMNEEVILEWSNSPQGNNFLETYIALDPFAPEDNNEYLFEGYEIFQYSDESDQTGESIAVFDVPNGVTRVIDGLPGEPSAETGRGTDSGVQTYYSISGLTNYQRYFFGVQAYAYNDASLPKVYRGPVTRVEVIPTRPSKQLSDAAVAALTENDAPDLVGIGVGIGDGIVTANVVNPGVIQDAEYTVEFYQLPEGAPAAGAFEEEDVIDPADIDGPVDQKMAAAAAGPTTYDIKRDGTVIFDGSATGKPAPQRTNVVLADGLQFSVTGPTPGFKDFQFVANNAGPLDPPESAKFGWLGFPDPLGLGSGVLGRQQTTGRVRWGFNAGGSSGAYGPHSSGTSFLGRAMRGNNLNVLGVYDLEMRFTQECLDTFDGTVTAADCRGYRRFQDGAIMELPFELWRTGVATPDDPSDDVRLIPGICDTALCGAGLVDGIYDIGGDHPASSADNDPFTDWVYWGLPSDDSPGQAGYDAFFAGSAEWAAEIMARTVLIIHNGGAAPPYPMQFPEVGSVIRITSSKPNQPGDMFTVSTAGYGVMDYDLATQQERLKDIGIVPNPYKGSSAYEVSQLTDEVRFTNMPDVATIRIFTLNGTLIRTINKQSPGVATIPWNLTTDHNLPIASGLYLIHVDVPDVGETTLKFAVVKKRIQLNVY
ncbi:MAG: T9SS type A sorting domain-containing protein [Bacteroidota bacterium]|nr:T9SS type A sorting domain-containing protein [Bacteroidota bacterium]